MKWKQYLQTLARTPRLGLFTLATTGLDPMKGDELIGVSFRIFEEDDKVTSCDKLLKLCTVENLQKSMDYHKVSQQMQVSIGYDEHTWKTELEARIGAQPVCWFTYNPQFAETFLHTVGVKWHVHDFSKLMLFAESYMPFEDVGTIDNLDRLMEKQRKAPGIRVLASSYGESCADLPGVLPMQTMLEVICRMAHRLADLDCPVMFDE